VEYSDGMRQKFDSERQLGGREEYAQQAMHERLEECLLVTDMLDDILETPYSADGTFPGAAEATSTDYSSFRLFHYLDTDTNSSSGWAWSLVGKTVDIRYLRSSGNPSTEQYQIALVTDVQQSDIDKEPIINVYQINYFGANRESVVATIDEPDIIGASGYEYTTRATTPYDHATLFDELGNLTDMLNAQKIEDGYLKTI